MSCSDQTCEPNKRNSSFVRDLENANTPQSTRNRSGILPLKRVFSRVLSDITNIVESTPSEPFSQVLNDHESVRNSTKSSRGLISPNPSN